MFTDRIELTLSSGKGGAGCVAFRREKFVVNGGPEGGDGGRGGDVLLRCDKNTHALSHLRGKKSLKADNGQPGGTRNCTGKSAKPLVVIVPPGTEVLDKQSGDILADLTTDGDEVLLLKGGKGGLGNTHFKSPTNQRPTYAQPGLSGESIEVVLDLKLIADVGLVGFPNVGKSTLISTISNAKPEIANYEFTTLTPKLGYVQVGELDGFVMADIPGIIDGASEGKGLGLQFLQHIERTKTLLFMVDCVSYMSVTHQIETIMAEVANYSEKLAQAYFCVALTRTDSLNTEQVALKMQELFTFFSIDASSTSQFNLQGTFFEQKLDETMSIDATKPFICAAISSATHFNISALSHGLYSIVKAQQ